MLRGMCHPSAVQMGSVAHSSSDSFNADDELVQIPSGEPRLLKLTLSWVKARISSQYPTDVL